MTATLYGAFPPEDTSPRLPENWPGYPLVPAQPIVPFVMPPPSYADNSETAAIAAIDRLDPAARARVLRYLVSKYGPVTP